MAIMVFMIICQSDSLYQLYLINSLIKRYNTHTHYIEANHKWTVFNVLLVSFHLCMQSIYTPSAFIIPMQLVIVKIGITFVQNFHCQCSTPSPIIFL